MFLAVDIGNTHVTFGAFEGDELRGAWRMRTARDRTSDEYGSFMTSILTAAGCPPHAIDAVLVGSVVPILSRTLTRVCRDYFDLEARFVTHETPTGITLDIDRPEEVGADRIVNAVAAHRLFGAPAIVVDFGTATTFDVIREGGVYVGGVIVPGIQITMDALFERAALLSRVELRSPTTVIGRNTAACLQSGYFYGFLGQMERILDEIVHEMGTKPQVIATGGLAGLIAESSPRVDVIEPDLTLHGLRLIHERLSSRPS